MKKRFLIILVALLWCNVGIAKDLESVFKKGISKKKMCKLTTNKKALKGTVLPGASYCHKGFQSTYIYLSKHKTEIIPPMDYYGRDIPHPEVYFIFENVTEPMKCKFVGICKYGNGYLKTITYSKEDALAVATDPEYAKIYEEKRKKEREDRQRIIDEDEARASGDITFTINDKKEQCEAIGFTPQTEKFADCVLRLVELEVKSQLQRQIELAISQGNQQVADELRAQRNQQGGQYLMDLGQKLLTPNSPASLPTTKNCTVRGTGVYKTVTCW